MVEEVIGILGRVISFKIMFWRGGEGERGGREERGEEGSGLYWKGDIWGERGGRGKGIGGRKEGYLWRRRYSERLWGGGVRREYIYFYPQYNISYSKKYE